MTVTATNDVTRVAMMLARDYLTDRARTIRQGLDGEWRNLDVQEAMLRVIDTIEITTTDGSDVTATLPHTHNGLVWHYIAGDALRHARLSDRFEVTHTGPYTYTLTFIA